MTPPTQPSSVADTRMDRASAKPTGERKMTGLDFLSYSDVHRKVVETIPLLRHFPITAVTYVPRGGSSIAAIVCQILDVPLVDGRDIASVGPARCLLVDDMIVTGRSLIAFRRQFLPHPHDTPTYVFASVPEAREGDAAVDVVSITVDPERYFLLPWEIGDIFRPSFPFPILVELDGVLRSRSSPDRALLTTPHVIAHLVSFGSDVATDGRWLSERGYRYQQLTALSDADETDQLADLIYREEIRFYLGSDARRGAIVKRICPECHVVVFPGMIAV